MFEGSEVIGLNYFNCKWCNDVTCPISSNIIHSKISKNNIKRYSKSLLILSNVSKIHPETISDISREIQRKIKKSEKPSFQRNFSESKPLTKGVFD